MEYEKCPVCGNEKIINVVTKEIIKYYSKTGKCIKIEEGGTIFWSYQCRCGWQSESFAE